MKKMLCVLLVLLFTSCLAANKRFDTMVTFGDSMSDNGNLYRFLWYQIPISPPYFEGHFSNGPVWIEQLFESYYPYGNLDGFQNYAVGGAGAVLSYKEKLPITLTMELNDYLYWNTYGKKETSLYAIWIGANNYLNGPTNVESITDSVVDAIGGVVERIISHGGDKFFIANIPDLGQVPQAKEMGTQSLLTELVQTHNRKLAVKVEELRLKYPEVTLVYFDVYAFFNEAMAHASDFGFVNMTDPCYLGSYSGWLVQYRPNDQALYSYLKKLDPRFKSKQWNMIKNNPELREAAASGYIYELLPAKNKAEPLNCEGYVFWDHVHPTTVTHSYIALKARQLLDEAGLEAFNPDLFAPG
ncbi:SGNH/GDSL hydrolase family protein [Legionella bononiensis]|uniref:SGNH/GDSL hydrolase family protein n=1 Tax=Legionella bononiensis TaxID=2793102 RepID=A0ABS1WFH2_9GAMM|nr:SGNH/GDSL hydrolase family protein [Legionella bononiensis]MBL7481553.1 SGNH/GDSL hydrolase family protein [Legionella bononiensis]MBL7528100.1 SGNH/GDSL hydrolase family protein [Legionella bononiensis]MBL7562576.1 SGNH/GDSL hydrolase family protein [Legionella bononiensis]